MNITVNSQLLAVELRLLNRIVPTKPAIAILSHALLRADDTINFYATDLEVGLSANCEGQINTPGIIVFPVARLLALVEQFPNDDVTLAIDKNHIAIQCGNFTSRLQALPADDFPIPPVPDGIANTLDAASFGLMISRTRYAVNDVASKHALRGILLTLTGGAAAMVATDGKRLTLATMGKQPGNDVKVVIPSKALDALHLSGDVELTVGAKHLFFRTEGRLLTSRMMEGKFPAYERIIPRDNDKVITADRSLLLAALRRVTLVSENNEAIYFSITPGALSLSAAAAGVGSAKEAVEITYDGPPLKMCVNGGYVLDFLNAASRQTVTIALKDSTGAVLLTDGEDHVAVIMLMK